LVKRFIISYIKTIILPGYSAHNKEWALEIRDKMNLGHEVVVVDWDHWKEDTNFSVKRELEKILKVIGKEEVNIIAKSVGVMVALNLIPKISSQINNEDRQDLLKVVLSKIPIENILCIQNENDKYVPFPEAEKFYHSVEPNLKVISKPRSDHDYPYPIDFEKFLNN